MVETDSLLRSLNSPNLLRSEDLLPLVYGELRQLAAQRMAGDKQPQTLQPTALVHEVWLRLANTPNPEWNDRAHFFRAAAMAMRHILVDRARARTSQKRGSGEKVLNLDDFDPADTTRDDRLLLVDDVLKRYELEDPEGARIVGLKFFGGLTESEIAQLDGVTERTIRRQWSYAKARLFQLICEEQRGE